MIKRCNQDKIRVGEVLLQKGLINPEQLKAALVAQQLSHKQQSHQKLGEILVQQGVVTLWQVRQALHEQFFRNVLATLIVTSSTCIPHLPRVFAQIPDIFQTQDLQEQLLGRTSEVGGATTQGEAASPAAVHYPAFVQSPLSPNASVASPLQGFCHPLNGQGWLSQGFRGRTHQGRMEFAYDLATPIGTPVYAMRAGTVVAVQDKYPDIGGGKENIARFNYVWLQHDGGYRSIYVHLQQGFRQKLSIKSGNRITAGQLIGYSGNSGWSTGPHLHVEVQQPGQKYRFTKTVPFAIAGACKNLQLARRSK